MITEDFCSFEVAKLLKEKGFDEPCYSYYDYERKVQHIDLPVETCDMILESNEYLAPTHQMAMKWLRKVHKILIVISPHDGKGYSAILYDIIDFIDYNDFRYIEETDCFFNFEEAVEAACLYALENLIKKE